MDKNLSYLFGFLQADGHLHETTRNRGELSIEILKRDENVLLFFDKLLSENTYISYRSRQTNFGYGEFIKLSIYDRSFRDSIKSYGFPIGKKDEIIEPPKNIEFSENDYVRGLIDGDGSLGITGSGIPFVSFVTKSEKMKDFYIDFLEKKTGKRKIINRNKRDNVYNIMMNKEDSQTITKELYYNNCVCLERKKTKAAEVLSWVRPVSMKTRNLKA